VADPAAADPHARTLPSVPPASSDAPDAIVGRTLGHFRVTARLGRGGMGAVYRAWDASLEREVAVKVLLGASDDARERFLREARVQAKLRHPNVVPIHFVGQEGDVSFLVMDVVDGESLADRLAREGTLPEAQALDVAAAIAAALAAGSDVGLVHRDVKPSNILFDRGERAAGETAPGRVMLADFGLAKTIHHAPTAGAPPPASPLASGQLTHAGAILGTPAYLAPEQARGEPVDFRADMYSLGVTLYEALTGQPPFTGGAASELLRQHVEQAPIAPRVLAPRLRAPVDGLVLRLLEKRPEARFASYAELRGAIEAAREKPTVPATLFVRAVALGIDLAAIGVYALVVGAITGSATVGWVVSALSFGALERAWSTPGKKLMRLRVVDRKGDPPSWGAMLLRSVLRVGGLVVIAFDHDALSRAGALKALVFVVALLGWAVALALGAHDRAARTREVFV
jgi:uncharacterized RDD family membrane protein YckC